MNFMNVEANPKPKTLKGKYAHECWEYDGLWIDEFSPEIQNCLCFSQPFPLELQQGINRSAYALEAANEGYSISQWDLQVQTAKAFTIFQLMLQLEYSILPTWKPYTADEFLGRDTGSYWIFGS